MTPNIFVSLVSFQTSSVIHSLVVFKLAWEKGFVKHLNGPTARCHKV